MIRVTNISFAYDKKEILRDVSLEIEGSEIVSILGRSGIGKTTLAKIISGFIRPSAGDVKINDSIIKNPSSEVVLIHQESDLFEWLTIEENITLFASRADSKKWLEVFGLEEYKERYPKTLSGGMKKKVSLARAVTARPSLIIMDEPFSSLDIEQKNAYYKEFQNLVKQRGISILIITHDIDEAYEFSDRVLFLGGRPAKIIGEKRPSGSESHEERRAILLNVLRKS